jgi:predicted Zn-dependent protease
MRGSAVRRIVFRLLLLALLASGLGRAIPGCENAPPQGPGHRPQALALTPRQELDLGTQAYEEVLKKYRRLPDNDPRVETVRKVGRNIARAAEIEPLRREINLHIDNDMLKWEFNVLESKEVNAFCLPGGKVAVFTGLLPVAEKDGELSEDQLATVMSHEIAHALAHHASERIAREQMYQHALDALNGALGAMNPETRKRLIGLLGAGAEARTLAYDRRQESEADHIGLFLMTFAGYDPREAVTFWEHMQQLFAGKHPPEILSDHPSDARRIAQIKRWVPAAQSALAAYKAGRVAPAGR